MNKIIFLILLSQVSLANQVVLKDLGKFGSWSSAIVQTHDLSGKDACISATRSTSDPTTVELYAERLANQSADAFTEPTVIAIVRSNASFVRGILLGDQGNKVDLTLMSNQSTPAEIGLIARLDDRTKALNILRQSSLAKIQLIDAKNAAVKTLVFSLRGSSKALDAAMSGCNLSL